ncbi:hypothetical protein SprV_0200859900 [Sparganum proliferum]
MGYFLTNPYFDFTVISRPLRGVVNRYGPRNAARKQDTGRSKEFKAVKASSQGEHGSHSQSSQDRIQKVNAGPTAARTG